MEGKRWLRFLLQVQAHLIDAVDAGLDGVDVIHQSLVNDRDDAGYTGGIQAVHISQWIVLVPMRNI